MAILFLGFFSLCVPLFSSFWIWVFFPSSQGLIGRKASGKMDKVSFNFHNFFLFGAMEIIERSHYSNFVSSFSSLSELIRTAKTIEKLRNFNFILGNSLYAPVSRYRGPVGLNGKQSLQLQLSESHCIIPQKRGSHFYRWRNGIMSLITCQDWSSRIWWSCA